MGTPCAHGTAGLRAQQHAQERCATSPKATTARPSRVSSTSPPRASTSTARPRIGTPSVLVASTSRPSVAATARQRVRSLVGQARRVDLVARPEPLEERREQGRRIDVGAESGDRAVERSADSRLIADPEDHEVAGDPRSAGPRPGCRRPSTRQRAGRSATSRWRPRPRPRATASAHAAPASSGEEPGVLGRERGPQHDRAEQGAAPRRPPRCGPSRPRPEV